VQDFLDAKIIIKDKLNLIQSKQIITSPCTDMAKIIVVNSGKKEMKKWFTHTTRGYNRYYE
jgi:hypothetical protein